MKDSHFKTPRSLNEAFGNDTRLEHHVVTNRVRDWLLAGAIGVCIGLIFALGIR